MDRRRPPLLPLFHRCPDRERVGLLLRRLRGARRTQWNDVAIRIFHRPGAHRAPGPHDAERAGLAGLLHRAVRSLSVPPPQHRRASRRRRHGDARRGQHDHSWAGDPLLDSEGRSREPRFPVRGAGARDGAPVDAPVRTRRGSAVSERGARLVLRDAGREGRHAGTSSFGGSCASCGNRIRTAPIRRGEPLLRALDPYLSYRRGPFAHVRAERVRRRGSGERCAAAPDREARLGRRSAGDDARPVSRAPGGHAGLAASPAARPVRGEHVLAARDGASHGGRRRTQARGR